MYGLRRRKGRLRLDLTIDELEAALGIQRSSPPPTWIQRAACRGVDPEVFFPDCGDSRSAQAAKAICDRCSVADACLATAMKRSELFGVWGGKTRRERMVLARQSRAAR